MLSKMVGTMLIAAGSLQAAQMPLNSTVKSIDGKAVDLADYRGKVVMVVNLASRCGFTKQYEQLQEIYEKYRERGFVVLGFPCNQFGGQEPGTDAEIKSFCESRFEVTFPMFSKIDVKGEKASPLYKHLTSKEAPIADKGPVKWNFEKFLVGRNGELLERFRSRIKPDSEKVVAAIETALAADPKAD